MSDPPPDPATTPTTNAPIPGNPSQTGAIGPTGPPGQNDAPETREQLLKRLEDEYDAAREKYLKVLRRAAERQRVSWPPSDPHLKRVEYLHAEQTARLASVDSMRLEVELAKQEYDDAWLRLTRLRDQDAREREERAKERSESERAAREAWSREQTEQHDKWAKEHSEEMVKLQRSIRRASWAAGLGAIGAVIVAVIAISKPSTSTPVISVAAPSVSLAPPVVSVSPVFAPTIVLSATPAVSSKRP